MGVLLVEEGTTWDEIVETAETLPASAYPEWLTGTPPYAIPDPGVLDVPLRDAGDHLVACATTPEGTDTAFPAALIEVRDG